MNARHWIAGHWLGTPNADSIDTATGEAIGRFADGGSGEADARLQRVWPHFGKTFICRQIHLRRVSNRLSLDTASCASGRRRSSRRVGSAAHF
ncbi:hypothetical protein J8I87_07070 [Paraburkholderia sp. LEh10]|uniref:hypothetical protein n=1 Tax=Paraburkholderia sp. LEh10 TaxID=2821353 RepID=UPI001AE718E0|nr:hypothetical protein [Paraburkholderia sp. LEh10]MBP0589483.1 hypothetical protein [Paraburkholderia sp. LEh10]